MCTILLFVWVGRNGQAFLKFVSGTALTDALKEARGEKNEYHFHTLREEIRKGIALGCIREEEYKRWVFTYETS